VDSIRRGKIVESVRKELESSGVSMSDAISALDSLVGAKNVSADVVPSPHGTSEIADVRYGFERWFVFPSEDAAEDEAREIALELSSGPEEAEELLNSEGSAGLIAPPFGTREQLPRGFVAFRVD
jgi:hypothetical protein